MPILVHSVLFAACAAAGEDAMARSVSAAATSGNLQARVRDMVRFASAYLSRFLTVPWFIVARQMAGPMISDRCGFVARRARVPLSLLGGICVGCDGVLRRGYGGMRAALARTDG